MKTIVQISLDFTSIPEALETARLAIRSGVDWLEAGTPLIISEGMNSIRALRAEFPDVPIVADLKAMDGGWLEAQMTAKAGATHVVVMERAHPETIKAMVQAAKDFGVKVMGDNLAAEDRVAAAKRLEDLGCDYVIHHIGYDERRGLAAMGKPYPSPLDQLREVVAAVRCPSRRLAVFRLNRRSALPNSERAWLFWALPSPSTLTPSRPLLEISKISSAWFATEYMLIATDPRRTLLSPCVLEGRSCSDIPYRC